MINVCVTNLGKYNEGVLVYKRIELPASEETIHQALEEIGIDGIQYEEYFLSDWEAPFELSEYTPLFKLNEALMAVEGAGWFDTFERVVDEEDDIEALLALAEETGNVEYTDSIIHDDNIEEILEATAAKDEWIRTKFFLSDADITAEWHYINGYGNLERLSSDRLERIRDDVLNAIYNEYLSEVIG